MTEFHTARIGLDPCLVHTWRREDSDAKPVSFDHGTQGPFMEEPSRSDSRAPWTHPGVSYFRGWRTDKFAPGWLFGDDDRPLRVGPRELVWNDELRYELRLKVDDLLFTFIMAPTLGSGNVFGWPQARPWQLVVWGQWSGLNWRYTDAPGF
jgi:hypothetical protein